MPGAVAGRRGGAGGQRLLEFGPADAAIAIAVEQSEQAPAIGQVFVAADAAVAIGVDLLETPLAQTHKVGIAPALIDELAVRDEAVLVRVEELEIAPARGLEFLEGHEAVLVGVDAFEISECLRVSGRGAEERGEQDDDESMHAPIVAGDRNRSRICDEPMQRAQLRQHWRR